jgi:hypothetical protein
MAIYRSPHCTLICNINISYYLVPPHAGTFSLNGTLSAIINYPL